MSLLHVIFAFMLHQVPTVCQCWTTTTPKGWMWSTTRSGSWTAEASTSRHARSSAPCSSWSITTAVSSHVKTNFFSMLSHRGILYDKWWRALYHWPRSLSFLSRACWRTVSCSNWHLSCTEASDSGLSQGCLGNPQGVPASWPQAGTRLLWRGLDG